MRTRVWIKDPLKHERFEFYKTMLLAAGNLGILSAKQIAQVLSANHLMELKIIVHRAEKKLF